MSDPAPSAPRRVVTGFALLVPLVVDPFGPDTLTAKLLVLALAGLTLALSEALRVVSGRRGALLPTGSEALLALLGLWSACSLAWAATPSLGLLGAAVLLALPWVARSVRTGSGSGDEARRWLARLVVVGVVAALVDVVAISLTEDALDEAEAKYASWLFTHNNLAAAYAVLLIPLAAGLALVRRPRAPWLLSLLVLLGYLAVLRSRASLAAALVGLGVVAVLARARGRMAAPGPRARGALLVAALLGLVLPFWDAARGLLKSAFYQGVSLMEDVGVGSLGDSLFRPILWRRAIDLAGEHPWGGVGAGNFMVAYSRFDYGRADIPHAHNDALQVLVELGVPGMALFVLLMVAVAWRLLALLARFRDDRATYLSVAALAGSLVVFWIVGLFEVPLALGASASVLAVLIGVAGGLSGPARWATRGAGRPAAAGVALVALVGLGVVGRHLPASAWHAQATARWVEGDLRGAQDRLQLLADLGLGGHLPHKLLGQLAWMAGDWEAAVRHYRDARALWPYGADLMIREGEALLALGRDDEALAVFRQALSAQPSDPDTIIGLLRALERTGHLDEATARAEYLVQSNASASLDVVATLGRLWARRALVAPGELEQRQAWIAARHFYAVLLQDGETDLWPGWAREFKHLTHQLQQTPDAPARWWSEYEVFLANGGWTRPATALWTSMDEDGVRVFPGWREVAGPPRPRSWR